MKIGYLLGVFSLSPVIAFASPDGFVHASLPKHKNTLVRHYSNEQQPNLNQMAQRSLDFPTQIVRVTGNVVGLSLSCEAIEDEIDRVFTQKITPDQFTYNTYVYCGYDSDSSEQYAMSFSIQSYFDPLTDGAIDYLKSYLETYQGYNLFDVTTLHIENAKGVIISLNILAGLKRKPDQDALMLYRQDRNNFYFKSNFDMRKELIADIYNRFYSNKESVILPFLDKWIFSFAGSVYRSILKEANYLELQPERIFVMEKDDDIFVSDFRFYFASLCMKRYPNKHCL